MKVGNRFMVYKIGLTFAFLLVLLSFDDLIWDLYYLLSLLFGKIKKEKAIPNELIESVPPKMLAIIVAAYKEEDVIEDVINNLMISTHYPHSMFHLFIGVYPNDPETSSICLKLSEKYKNVHAVTHVIPGPSSKADNINNVVDNIKVFEKQNNIEFKAIVIHDSEDVVHPYEFILENYLLEEHPAIQIPVFPLIEKPRFGNIFKNMVTSTYADEFAENHYRMMPIRNSTKAFVPSAGTGFAIRRDVIEAFSDEEFFPVGSLTEDYKLSFEFKKRGFDLYYPLEYVKRINYEGKEVREYIATRSMFPRRYSAAVRQKARWIHGITMQSFSLSDVLKNKNLNFSTRYSFYKDWKAKFSNLLTLPAYLIFIYFILSYFVDLPVMFPKYSLSWYIMLSLTILMIHRQFLRFNAVNNIYGFRSALIASFFPPLMPFRMVLGNIINCHATLRAWKNHLFGNKKVKNKKKKSVKWSKTDHEFLEPEVLKRFHRKLGDKLLEKSLISPSDLRKAILQSQKETIPLSLYLFEEGKIAEKDLVECVCQVSRIQYFDGNLGNFILDFSAKDYDLSILKKLNVLPLFVYGDTVVLVSTIDSNIEEISKYFPNMKVEFVYTFTEQLKSYFEGEEANLQAQQKLAQLNRCLAQGKLEVNQAIIALRYANNIDELRDIFKKMGVLVCETF